MLASNLFLNFWAKLFKYQSSTCKSSYVERIPLDESSHEKQLSESCSGVINIFLNSLTLSNCGISRYCIGDSVKVSSLSLSTSVLRNFIKVIGVKEKFADFLSVRGIVAVHYVEHLGFPDKHVGAWQVLPSLVNFHVWGSSSWRLAGRIIWNSLGKGLSLSLTLAISNNLTQCFS